MATSVSALNHNSRLLLDFFCVVVPPSENDCQSWWDIFGPNNHFCALFSICLVGLSALNELLRRFALHHNRQKGARREAIAHIQIARRFYPKIDLLVVFGASREISFCLFSEIFALPSITRRVSTCVGTERFWLSSARPKKSDRICGNFTFLRISIEGWSVKFALRDCFNEAKFRISSQRSLLVYFSVLLLLFLPLRCLSLHTRRSKKNNTKLHCQRRSEKPNFAELVGQ